MMVKTIDDSVDNVIKMSGVILSTLRNKTAAKVDTIYPHLADIMLTNFYKIHLRFFISIIVLKERENKIKEISSTKLNLASKWREKITQKLSLM